MSAYFFCPGEPRPQGSTRSFLKAGKVITTSATKGLYPWRSTIAHSAISADVTPTERPVYLELDFYLSRPKSHRTANGATIARGAPPCPSRPDLDKLIRAVLDALTGVAYRDDAQVYSLRAKKFYCKPEEASGVGVTITELWSWKDRT